MKSSSSAEAGASSGSAFYGRWRVCHTSSGSLTLSCGSITTFTRAFANVQCRVPQLPDNVDPEHVEAKLDNGELTVKVRTPRAVCSSRLPWIVDSIVDITVWCSLRSAWRYQPCTRHAVGAVLPV